MVKLRTEICKDIQPMKERITEQDLLNIGSSKNYVAQIVDRIKEYKKNNDKKQT